MKNIFKLSVLILVFALSFTLFSCGGKKNPPSLDGISLSDVEVVYDGQEHSALISGTLPEGVTVVYSDNGFIDVGVYTVEAKFYFNDEYMAGNDLSATVTINAPDEEPEPPVDEPDPPVGDSIDLSHLSMDNGSFVYDGTAKSLSVKGQLPAGVTVSYKNNGKTDAGEYSVVAEFYLNGTYLAGKDITASLVIAKAEYDMSSITFSDHSTVYNGQPVVLAISGTLPSGVVVSYDNNTYTNAGVYTVVASFRGDDNNYKTIPSLQAVLTIEKASYDLSSIGFSDKTVPANGEEQGIEISGTLPEGVTVSYSANKTPVEPGIYLITAGFAVSDPQNYNVPASLTATLTLTPLDDYEDVDLSGVSFTDGSATYDGNEKTHTVSGTLPEGVTVEYTVVSGEKLVNAGTYEIVASFLYNGEFIGVTKTASYVINKATYDLSLITIEDKTVTYDGNEHSILINGRLPDGVKPVYSGNGQLNAGKYDVKVIFTVVDLVNYESVDLTLEATLLINKASYDMSGVKFKDKTVLHDGEKHNLTIEGTLPEGVSVSYSQVDISEVGTYLIKASFTVEDDRNYNVPESLEATLVIKSGVSDGLIIEDGVVIGYNGTDTEVDIPSTYNGVTVYSIKSGAFMDNTSITAVYIPDTVVNIGNNAFKGCTSLKSVRLSNQVKTIGQYAFLSCPLDYIVLPDSLTSIGFGAYGNTKPVSITLPFLGGSHKTSTPYLCFIFGSSDYASSATVVPDSLKEVILSDACTKISAFAFFGCESIENVVIGSGVKSINNNAFRGCTSLTSIYIPSTVESIPANAYYYNSPFFGLAENFLIVTESSDISGFGMYWHVISENSGAIVAMGYSYEDYLKDKDELRNPDPTDAYLNLIMIGTEAVDGFMRECLEYTVNCDVNKAYPTVTVMKSSHIAKLAIEQASKNNGGVATITVTSGDGSTSKVYKIMFNKTGTFKTNATIVNKDGAKGVVSFIFDDGHKDTATILKRLVTENSYEKIKFSFAIKTQDLATFTDCYGNMIDRYGNATDSSGNLVGKDGNVIAQKGSFSIDSTSGCPILSDGTIITDQKAEYYIDENGNYSFVPNQANVDFWRDILINTNYSDIITHTHTSAFWGINDEGGRQEYLNQALTEVLYKYMPKNSVHKEVYGSKQIVEYLFSEFIYGEKHLVMGRPGLTDCNKVVASLNGVEYDTCYSWFNAVLDEAIEKCDYYFGRSNNKKIMLPSDFRNETVRKNIRTYIPTSATIGDGASDGIAFINEAINAGGWAAFSFHCINTGWHTITEAEAKALFDYTESLGDDVWVASITEAALYYAEWSTATLSSSYDSTKDEISVTLTDKEEDSVCIMPLTVKVLVPGDWENAEMDGAVVDVQYDDYGSAFVLVNIVPDSGVKTIKSV